MFEITRAQGGTKTARCRRCKKARGFRSELELTKWMRKHVCGREDGAA